VTAGNEKVAVRVPNHPLTLELLNQLTFPLAAPSANPFGSISPTNSAHVHQYFGKSLPLILEGGPCMKGIESTINPGTTILRVGVSVMIYENQVVCRKAGGLSITAAEACQLVMERILGSSAEPNTRQRFFPIDNGFENLGKEVGVNLWVASFGILVPVIPRP
jgi:hypothetical protein